MQNQAPTNVDEIQNTTVILEGLGCKVISTDSAEVARTIIRSARLGAVILDVPSAGEKTVHNIETIISANYRGIGIIVISGAVDIETAQHLFRHGVVDVLTKPFSHSRLQNAVLTACMKSEEKSLDRAAKNNIVLLVGCGDCAFVEKSQ